MTDETPPVEDKPILLVAVDGSEGSKRAVDHALEIATAMDADITLAHVVDWSDYTFINVIEIEDRTKMRRREEKNARENILEPLAQTIAEAGVDVSIDLRFGHPARTLTKLADEIDAKMIIAGTRGRSDVKSLMLGSLSHGLLQMAKKPLLLVP